MTETFARIKLGHLSMQFSDPRRQIVEDAKKLFARAKAEDLHWITGTEAGPAGRVRPFLAEAAQTYGFKIVFSRTDSWIAVNKKYIDRGWDKEYIQVHEDRGFTTVNFIHTQLGRVSIGAGHLMLRGAQSRGENYQVNNRMNQALTRWAREKGRGSALVFYGGDQNINDKKLDTFLGAPLTSAADELGKHPKTSPYGPIDVIASYDRDGRVKAHSWKVYTDREFKLNVDHFYCEAEYDVRLLEAC